MTKMSLMKSFREMVADTLAGLAIQIANRDPPPGIDRVESAVAIGRIFDGNASRQQFDHDTASTGYFRRPESNAHHLGRV
jgi:hypothetical protein